MDENNKTNTDESKWTPENEEEYKELKKQLQLLEVKRRFEEETQRQQDEYKDLKELKKQLQVSEMKRRLKEETQRQQEEERKIKEAQRKVDEFHKDGIAKDANGNSVYFDEGVYSDGSVDVLDDLEGTLQNAEIEKEFSDIIISPRLTVTFLKPSATLLDLMVLEDGMVYTFTDKELESNKWGLILKKKLCKSYTMAEMVALRDICLRAFEYQKIEEKQEKMTAYDLLKELYQLAYRRSEKARLEVIKRNGEYIAEMDSSIAKITLVNDKIYGECIYINEKVAVIKELLEYLNSGWEPLEMKRIFKKRKWLVTDGRNQYSNAIQTKQASKFSVLKVIKIPVSNIEKHIHDVIEEMKEPNGEEN